MRQHTEKTLLYTEMIMDDALIYNHPHRLESFLGHSDIEHPLAVQLGGSDPEKLGKAAAICEEYKQFHEINLNCGCPSNKAKKAGFGAELMLEPDLVRQIVYEMKKQVSTTDITVKCRLGVTGREQWGDLVEFVQAVKSGGVNTMIIHARHCVLKGLSPAQNRNIPPLCYDQVHELVQLFPDMRFILNGGITSFDQAKEHLYNDNYVSKSLLSLPEVHGVMIGREAYNNPYSMCTADQNFFGMEDKPVPSRGHILEAYLDYAVKMQEQDAFGNRSAGLAKPLHNFFTNCKNNPQYKVVLDQMLKQESKLIDEGKIQFNEFIWRAVDSTIDKNLLWNE